MKNKTILLVAVCHLWAASVMAQTVINFTASPYTENFDSMGPDGTTTPAGWYVGSGSLANSNIVATNSGTIAPTGTIMGFNCGEFGGLDRALGLGPTGADRNMEVRIQNNAASPIKSFTVQYDGEMWRTANQNNTNRTTIRLRYSLDGATYTDLGAAWNFITLTNMQVSSVPLNGNEITNRVEGIGAGQLFTLPAAVPVGGILYLRWYDANDSGFTDPVIAIDNVVFSIPDSVALASPTNGQAIASGTPLLISAAVWGNVTNVAFFVDDTPVHATATPPYSYSTLLPGGSYQVYARADYASGAVLYSSTNSITIAPNVPPVVAFGSPTNGQIFMLGQVITNTILASDSDGLVTNVAFYADGGWQANDNASPYVFLYQPSQTGALVLRADATDNSGATTSTNITVNILPNSPPVWTNFVIFEAPNETNSLTVPVGRAVTNWARVGDPDASTPIAAVLFYNGATLMFSNPVSANFTNPMILANERMYAWIYKSPVAGVHTLTAVAVDSLGARATSAPVVVTVTNNPAYTYLVTNGAPWRYFDLGTDPGANWMALSYDDSSWSNGLASLGYGDGAGTSYGEAHPTRTIISYGPNASSKYPAYFFRHPFYVSDPSVFTNLVVRLLPDDAGAVYLNGNLIYTNNMPATWTYTNFAAGGAQSQDGTVFLTSGNISATNLQAGWNILAVEIHQQNATSSDITFDIMLLAQPPQAPQPVINFAFADGLFTLSWPDTYTGFTLKESAALGGAPNWAPSTLTPAHAGGLFTVTVPLAGQKRFFQLSSP